MPNDGPDDSTMDEGGASTLSQRDASGEVDEHDLKEGERRRGWQSPTPRPDSTSRQADKPKPDADEVTPTKR